MWWWVLKTSKWFLSLHSLVYCKKFYDMYTTKKYKNCYGKTHCLKGNTGNIIHLLWKNTVHIYIYICMYMYLHLSPGRYFLANRASDLLTYLFFYDRYGQLYVIVLRHQPRPGSVGAEIVLYQIQRYTTLIHVFIFYLLL